MNFSKKLGLHNFFLAKPIITYIVLTLRTIRHKNILPYYSIYTIFHAILSLQGYGYTYAIKQYHNLHY